MRLQIMVPNKDVAYQHALLLVCSQSWNERTMNQLASKKTATKQKEVSIPHQPRTSSRESVRLSRVNCRTKMQSSLKKPEIGRNEKLRICSSDIRSTQIDTDQTLEASLDAAHIG
jgi:hypothetical protein